MKIVIIVPCYNEHETIEIYYNEVIKHINDGNDYNILFVNDGSKDNSLEIMRSLAEKDKRVLYLSFSRNFGKEAAMYAGLDMANKLNCDCAIMMDVDLQDPPYLIKDMLKAHEEGYNLVLSRQKNRSGQKLFGKICSLGFYKLYAFITKDKHMAHGSRDYCLMDKKVVKAFLSVDDHERFTKGLFNYVGFRTKFIEFDYEERVAGTTKWSFRKLLKYAFLGMREFSRFYEYIPKIFAWVFIFILGYDIGDGIYNSVKYDVNFWDYTKHSIRFDIAIIFILLVLFYILRLMYNIRDDSRRRPHYICEDTNIEINEEK